MSENLKVHSQYNLILRAVWSPIKDHIESFPVYEIWYANNHTKNYLSATEEAKVNYKCYLKYFKENYNLKFGRLQTVVCLKCEVNHKLKKPSHEWQCEMSGYCRAHSTGRQELRH